MLLLSPLHLSKTTLIAVAIICTGFASLTSQSKTAIDDLQFNADSMLEINPTEAFKLYKNVLKNFPEEGEALEKAKLLSRLGQSAYLMGAFSRAIPYMEEALVIYNEYNRDSLEADQLSNLGSAYYFGELNEPEKTLDYYKQAYNRFLKSGNPVLAEFSKNYMGYVHWAQGNKEAALKIHLESFHFFDSLSHNRGIAVSSSDVGFTLNSLGRFQEALPYLQTALRLSGKLEDTLIMIPVLNNIGISYLNLNQLATAEDYSTQSLLAARKRGLNLRTKEALQNLHKVYSAMGLYKKAYETHLQLKEIDDTLRNAKHLKKLIQLQDKNTYALKEAKLKGEQERKDAVARERLQREQERNTALITGFILLSIILLLMIVSIRQKIKHNKKISAQNEQLEFKNKELQELLDELQRTQAKLIQYEKLASLGILTSGVAHEINNPLNFIQAGIYGLQDKLEALPDNEQKEEADLILQHMNTGMSRINHVITELNRFSKNSISKDLVPCNIHQILENCILVLKPKTDTEKCVINTNFADRDLEIQAHEGSLHQIFSNVIMNAIQATQGGGVINISTTLLENDNVQVVISDNGAGMDVNTLKHAFDPFFSTRPPGEGIGLGLYVGYKLVHSHHGKIDLQSELNEGTKATITLPSNPSL